jgi:hypothetical protein
MSDDLTGIPISGGGATTAPLTWGQQAILNSIRWIGDLSYYYNVQYRRALPDCDLRHVVGALSSLIARHQVLRTRFTHEPPRQTVHDEGVIPFALHTVPDGEDADEAAAAVLQEMAREVFTEDEWPVRVAVVQQDGAPRHLVLVLNHLAVDGWALSLVTEQLDALLTDPDAPFEGIDWQPVDQVAYEQGDQGAALRSRKSAAHWQNTLRSLPHSMFDYPATSPEPLRFVKSELRSQAAAVAAGLIADRLKVSASSVLLAAGATVLGHLTGHPRVAVQLIVANRFDETRRSLVAACAEDGILAVDTATGSFDETVRSSYRASLNGYRCGYYDFTAVRRERAELAEVLGADREVSAFFNDARQKDRWPDLPAVESEAALLDLLGKSEIHRIGAWPRNDEKFFLSTTYSPDTCLLQLLTDTAYLSAETGAAALNAIDRLLVRGAFGTVDPAAVLAGCELPTAERPEGWVRHGLGWVNLPEAGRLVASALDSPEATVAIEEIDGADRLVARVVLDLAGGEAPAQEELRRRCLPLTKGRTDFVVPDVVVVVDRSASVD